MDHEHGFGWIKDKPDTRDYHLTTPEVRRALSGVSVKKDLPASADLRPQCPPVDDQGKLSSCTANAAVGIVEYLYGRVAKVKHFSRLFTYRVTRDLEGSTGDSGATLRGTAGALALAGCCDESRCPYSTGAHWDKEPTALMYALASNAKALTYFRLDTVGAAPLTVITNIKQSIAAGLPVMFGFDVYESYVKAAKTGIFPYPATGEQAVGGHAIVAVGYDDAKKWFIIRNSWGTAWGDHGYGYLPYDYLLKGLASDWWCIASEDIIDTGLFGY